MKNSTGKTNYKKIIVIVVAVLWLFILVPTFLIGKKPFKDLQVPDIKSATVWLIAPVEEIQVEDWESLAACLQEVVIYEEKVFYDVPDGGNGPLFILEMADGTEMRIALNNSHLVIDGGRYRVKGESYEQLREYAYGLRAEK